MRVYVSMCVFVYVCICVCACACACVCVCVLPYAARDAELAGKAKKSSSAVQIKSLQQTLQDPSSVVRAERGRNGVMSHIHLTRS